MTVDIPTAVWGAALISLSVWLLRHEITSTWRKK